MIDSNTPSSETTEVWSGIDNIISRSLEVLSKIQATYDLCLDSTGVSPILEIEPIKKAYFGLKNREVKIRIITEITTDNIAYCKEVMRIGDVRHLEGIKGNFVIADRARYAAKANIQKGKALPQLVVSTSKEFVEQQQYFFQTLWDKAIPAQIRIREIEEGVRPEKTEVIYGPENTIKVSLECFARVKERLDSCCDHTMPSIIVSTEPIRDASVQLVKRGIRPRFITEITKENIRYCKELVKMGMELRHLDNVKGNFAISESDYTANAAQSASAPLPQLIHSNVKAVIEQQQYFFETLWSKAIPAEQRIREIEEGIKPEVIETIREPKETQERVFELIKSANEEILIIFSTANAFRRQEKAGAVDFLIMTAKSKGVKVRILSPIDDYIKNIIDKIKREEDNIKIEIRNIEEPLQTKVSVLIVDRASLLSAELKNDSKETSLEAIGLATYSNSNPTVLSYASIFESLWNQTELYEHIRYLYEQLKSHDKLKQEFMDIAAHELRTPIQPILGLAQVLKDQVSDSAQINFLDVILRNAKRLQKLQEEMLDVTRIESGSMRIHKESFNLNELIFDVLQDFRAQLNDDARIKLDYKSDGDVWVVADKNGITQVISNLLDNAIKFTKAGRIAVQLRNGKSKETTDPNQVIVGIKDEGPGIDPSVMPRLFTKFATKSEKGTGLGLFISKSIIEAYDGKIWAENNIDGKGATFTFTLPIQKPQQEQQQVRST